MIKNKTTEKTIELSQDIKKNTIELKDFALKKSLRIVACLI